MKQLISKAAVLGLTLSIAACSPTSNQVQGKSGFLPNYSLLKPVASPAGTKIYVYKNPNVKRSDYHAVIVQPVVLYQTASKDDVSNAQIEQARANINTGIKQIVARKFNVTNQAGPGVVRLQTAITGAELESDGFKPRNLIPISAAIKLASMATGMEKKKPVLVIELKFVDSQTGTLLKEVVSTISGEKISSTDNVAASFDKLATAWVQQALQYSNH